MAVRRIHLDLPLLRSQRVRLDVRALPRQRQSRVDNRQHMKNRQHGNYYWSYQFEGGYGFRTVFEPSGFGDYVTSIAGVL